MAGRTAKTETETPRPDKIFPVSWDQFHRDSRALAWRLHEAGPFEAIVCITRGGLVPAAIVARELNVRMIETVCVVSYRDYKTQGDLSVLKAISPEVTGLHKGGKRVLIVDDLVDTGKTARVVRDLLPDAHFATVYAKPMGRPLVDTFITEVSQDTWIYFPWDTGWRSSRRSARVGTSQKKLAWRNPDADTTPPACERGRDYAGAATGEADADASYASQPIHILVGYAAGGGVDIIARLLQEPLKAALGQTVIVENRAGASAMLATGAVAKATPDGYTLLACASGEVAINHFLFKEKMAYDPAKELVPIALVGIVPCVIVVGEATRPLRLTGRRLRRRDRRGAASRALVLRSR